MTSTRVAAIHRSACGALCAAAFAATSFGWTRRVACALTPGVIAVSIAAW